MLHCKTRARARARDSGARIHGGDGIGRIGRIGVCLGTLGIGGMYQWSRLQRTSTSLKIAGVKVANPILGD